MKRLNKNGFTLVELLAVIVVLAVIMLLAVNAVLPQMNKARKNAFVTEAESVIEAAQKYYVAKTLAGDDENITPSEGCVSVDDLKVKYLDKNDDNFEGVVTMEVAPDGGMSYVIWLYSEQYYINETNLSELNEDAVKEMTAGITKVVSCP